jgi:acyl carrier protein
MAGEEEAIHPAHGISLPLVRDEVVTRLVAILEHITSDWDLGLSGQIEERTRLVADLEFESIDVVMFIIAIEQEFGRTDLGFDQLLLVDGEYVEDLTVAEVATFVIQRVSSSP